MAPRLHIQTQEGKLTLRWMSPHWSLPRAALELGLALTFFVTPEPLRIPWLLVMSLLAYVEAVRVLNGTQLRVSSETLEVRPFPLLWPGTISVATKDIRNVTHRRDANRQFRIEAELHSRALVTLATRIPTEHHASSIEELVTQHLKLPQPRK